MKRLLIIAFVLLALRAQAQLITGIGSSEFNPLSNSLGQWAIVSSATTATVSGVDTADPSVASTLDSAVNILSSSLLTLTGALNSPLPSKNTFFRLYLYDASGYGAYATYNWSTFVGGASSTQTLINDPGTGGLLDRSAITHWGLTVSGGGEFISFTLDEIAAVPEPGAMALVGLGMGVLMLSRKRPRRA